MKLTSVSVLSNETEGIRFDLRNVESQSPYMVRTIIGLDAEELISKFYGFSKDGTKKFHDFKMKPRDIVMRIVLNPRYNIDESTSYIRDSLYKMISATRSGELELQFNSGASTVARIYGRMTKFEVPYFSKTPELQITIHCEVSMFRGINPVVMGPGDLSAGTNITVPDSLSTAPHGCTMWMTLDATLSTLVIADQNPNPEWEFLVVPESDFIAGDQIILVSDFNDRQLFMIRGAVVTHLLDRIDPESVWPIIFPGNNEFYFPGAASFSWAGISYFPAYWGV